MVHRNITPGLTPLVLTSLLGFVCPMTGCGSGTTTPACTVGTVQACVCSTGQTGTQSCQTNATWAPCTCTTSTTTLPGTTGVMGACNTANGLGCTCTADTQCPPHGHCGALVSPRTGAQCLTACWTDADCPYPAPYAGRCVQEAQANTCMILCAIGSNTCPSGLVPFQVLDLHTNAPVCICAPPAPAQ